MKKSIKEVLNHWYHTNRVFIKHFGFTNWLNSECYKHDIDKLLPILFNKYDKQIHKNKANHHIENVMKLFENSYSTKGILYYKKYIFEMLADWESSRFTKKNKQMTCEEFWNTKKSNIRNIVFVETINSIIEHYDLKSEIEECHLKDKCTHVCNGIYCELLKNSIRKEKE